MDFKISRDTYRVSELGGLGVFLGDESFIRTPESDAGLIGVILVAPSMLPPVVAVMHPNGSFEVIRNGYFVALSEDLLNPEYQLPALDVFADLSGQRIKDIPYNIRMKFVRTEFSLVSLSHSQYDYRNDFVKLVNSLPL